MHIDHIVPVIVGGGDDIENLCASCPTCNLKKGAKSEEAMLAALLSGYRTSFLDGVEKSTTPDEVATDPELDWAENRRPDADEQAPSPPD